MAAFSASLTVLSYKDYRIMLQKYHIVIKMKDFALGKAPFWIY